MDSSMNNSIKSSRYTNMNSTNMNNTVNNNE